MKTLELLCVECGENGDTRYKVEIYKEITRVGGSKSEATNSYKTYIYRLEDKLWKFMDAHDLKTPTSLSPDKAIPEAWTFVKAAGL